MLNTIAVMNTKGGVGKSTLVLALAETMSAFHGKNVLVIDSDAQASVSSMLMSVTSLYSLQQEGRTIVDYLVSTVLNNAPTDWTHYIVPKVSDVDDARGVYLLPSDMQLTLLEREVSKESRHMRLRSAIGRLLADAGNVFDVVLVDCPPGLSVLTECWLREASFHASPTKPDYVSICGLEVFRRFKALNPEMGFARNLGVIVNLEDGSSKTDTEYTAWLGANAENRCFAQSIPRVKALQDAARHQSMDRSFAAKYPGAVGAAVRALTAELLERLRVDQTAAALAAAADEQRRASEPGTSASAPAAPAAAVSATTSADAPQNPDSQPDRSRSMHAPAWAAEAQPSPAVSTPAAPAASAPPQPPSQTAGPVQPAAASMSSGSPPPLPMAAPEPAARDLSATMAAAAMAPVTMAMSVAAAAMAPLTRGLDASTTGNGGDGGAPSAVPQPFGVTPPPLPAAASAGAAAVTAPMPMATGQPIPAGATVAGGLPQSTSQQTPSAFAASGTMSPPPLPPMAGPQSAALAAAPMPTEPDAQSVSGASASKPSAA